LNISLRPFEEVLADLLAWIKYISGLISREQGYFWQQDLLLVVQTIGLLVKRTARTLQFCQSILALLLPIRVLLLSDEAHSNESAWKHDDEDDHRNYDINFVVV